MTKARVLLDQKQNIFERFRVELKVFEVEPREKQEVRIRGGPLSQKITKKYWMSFGIWYRRL